MNQPTFDDTAISDAETVILEVLWQHAPLTAQAISSRVENQDWSLATVKTLINRLLKKGALKHTQEGRQYLYSPVIERDVFLKGRNRSFLQRFYQGKLGQLVAEFASHERLDDDEIRDIRAILDAMENQHD